MGLQAQGYLGGMAFGIWLMILALTNNVPIAPGLRHSHRWQKRLQQLFRRAWQMLTHRRTGIGVAGCAFCLGLGFPFSLSVLVGGGAGVFIAQMTSTVSRRRLKAARLREVLLLYDAVDLYARAGYSLQDGLQAASSLTPLLRPSVERCLRRWPQGPLRALGRFQQELGIPEAELVVSILHQALQVGNTRMPELLSGEVEKLERLRQQAIEEQLSLRPVYLTLYLALPGFTLVGLIFFPFGFQAMQMIQQLQAF